MNSSRTRALSYYYSKILKELPSSPDEGIGFNELLRRLEEKGVTNSPTTLSKYLKILESYYVVRKEVIRARPPKLVKFYKDPKRVQEDRLKNQLLEFVRQQPFDSLLTKIFLLFRQKTWEVPTQLEANASLAETLAEVTRANEVFTRSFGEAQEWIEKYSSRIVQAFLYFLALGEEIEEGIKAGRLDSSIRDLPFLDAVRKLQQLKASNMLTKRGESP